MKNEDFDELWQKAFSEADEPASDRLWGRIEPHLPPKRRRLMPLLWLGAAALLALAVGSPLWWNALPQVPEAARQAASGGGRQFPQKQELITAKAHPPAMKSPGAVSGKRKQRRDETVAAVEVAALTKPGAAAGQTTIETDVLPGQVQTADRVAARQLPEARPAAATPTALPPDEPAGYRAAPLHATGPVARVMQAFEKENHAAVLSEKSPSQQDIAGTDLPPAGQLAPRPVQWEAVALSLPEPKALPLPVVPPGVRPLRPQPGRWYASLHAGGLAFHPSIMKTVVNFAPATSLPAFNTGSSYPQQLISDDMDGHRLFSPQVSAEVGKMLSKHFFLESGLHYQRNRAMLQDALTVIDKSTGTATGYLYDIVNNASRSASDPRNVVSLPLTTRYDVTFTQVSVPLQLGYKLLPARPLSLTVSIGLSADYLLASRLAYLSSASLETSSGRDAFQQLTMSGMGSAGASYRVGPKWYVSLKGFFKKSLSNFSRRDPLELFPWSAGVAAGVRHEF